MPFSVSQLTGPNGFKIEPGGSVSLGDVNGDGLADIIIGAASAAAAGRSGAGQTYVVFGSAGARPAVISTAAIGGSTGFVVLGGAAGDQSGFAVAGLGDVNGDGVGDFAIGAIGADPGGISNAGAAYVLFGRGAWSTIDLAALTTADGLVLTGPAVDNRMGFSISGTGDFNQDGFNDFAVGAPVRGSWDNTQHAYAYVVYGGAALGGTLAAGAITGANGVTYTGTHQDRLGIDVAGVGDVNGDGRPDLVIEGHSASFGSPFSPAYAQLEFGPPGASVDPRVWWTPIDDGHDVDFNAAGDFNGDGIDDFIVTLNSDESYDYSIQNPDHSYQLTTAVVVFGRTGGWEGVTDNLNSNRGAAILGGDGIHASVASAGDFNGDGVDDIIVGQGSAAYILYGSTSLPFQIDLRDVSSVRGLVVTDTGVVTSVAGAGDINGDGFHDVVISGSNGTFVVYGFGSPRTGTAGNDVLTGTIGADTIDGLAGDDVLRGFAGADRLNGGEGNDVLDGGTGADTLSGGSGSDIYYIDNAGDFIIEPASDGFDRVASSVSYVLAPDADIEKLEAITLSDTVALDLTGNGFGNVIVGNQGRNTLKGEGGADELIGAGGDDVLDGGTGADSLSGGSGSDIYYIDNADDFIVEPASDGFDRVVSSVSYVLAPDADIEKLEAITLSDTLALDLTGNGFGNVIVGNQGRNTLKGEGGADELIGAGGDDVLDGGTGADVLNGGEGADTMYGGLGNDTYYVDSASDVVVELGDEGSDRIATSSSFTLQSGQSIESFEVVNSTSTDNIDLTGNEFDQTIAGNFGINQLFGNGGNDGLVGYAGDDELDGGQGHDVLIGGVGNDRMTGGVGNDKYYVDAAGDVVIELAGGGTDTVATAASFTLAAGAEVEFLEPVTFSSTDALSITGNGFDNRIFGNSGDNILNGGAGSDTLEGLGGKDTFVFSSPLGSSNVDTVNDFTVGDDKFLLDSTTFGGLTAGTLAAGAFTTGATAVDADDRVIYNKATGALWFDADGSGSGAAVQFARVASGLNLSAGDFVVSSGSASASAMAMNDAFVVLPRGEIAVQSFMDDEFEASSPDPLATFGGGDDPRWMLTLMPLDASHEDAWLNQRLPTSDPWG